MDKEKLGKKIAKLRNKKNMTQLDLGDLLHVSDKTISKWESGRSKPAFEFLEEMSKIFEVDIDYFYKDKSLENKIKTCINKGFKYIKKHWHHIIFTLVLSFFAIYFFNTIDSLEMYEIISDDKVLTFDNGYFIKSKSKIVIAINNINYNSKEDDIISQKLKLYTFNNEDKIYLYETDNIKDVLYKDFVGYNLTRTLAKDLNNNLYLEIENLHENNTVTSYATKLSLKVAITSNTIFYIDKLNIDNVAQENKYSYINDFILVQNKYQKIGENQIYFKKYDDYQIYFNLDSNKFIYKEKEKNQDITMSYFYNKNEISYLRRKNNKSNIYFIYYKDLDKLICYKGNCDNYLDAYDYIKDKFNKIINEFSKS